MALKMNLWQINEDKLHAIPIAQLDFEDRLESWIASDPSVLGMEVIIIGQQVQTAFGGRIDLLALDRQASCIVLELKRGRTPRDVVAQILDYGSWVKDLRYPELNQIALNCRKKDLGELYQEYFAESIPDAGNTNHSLVIVASELDESSERIVNYLTEQYRLSINAVFFNFFKVDSQEFLARAWFKDPIEVLERSESKSQPPWTGYYFVNVGEGEHRNWNDNLDYGYIGAGQGTRYADALKRLKVGDKIFAYIKGNGYVGFGEVSKEAVMVRDLVIEPSKKTLLELPLRAPLVSENSDNPELSEWAVSIAWIKTFPREQAKTFKGVFANQNVVCKLRNGETIEFLQKEFGVMLQSYPCIL